MPSGTASSSPESSGPPSSKSKLSPAEAPGPKTVGPSTTLRSGRDDNSVAGASISRGSSCVHNRIVIPTGADPDFLLRRASNDHECGSPQREPHAVDQRHGS